MPAKVPQPRFPRNEVVDQVLFTSLSIKANHVVEDLEKVIPGFEPERVLDDLCVILGMSGELVAGLIVKPTRPRKL